MSVRFSSLLEAPRHSIREPQAYARPLHATISTTPAHVALGAAVTMLPSFREHYANMLMLPFLRGLRPATRLERPKVPSQSFSGPAGDNDVVSTAQAHLFSERPDTSEPARAFLQRPRNSNLQACAALATGRGNEGGQLNPRTPFLFWEIQTLTPTSHST